MAKKLWGGRFAKPTHPLVEEFTRSIHYDYALAEYDIIGSLAHVDILNKAGYITSAECAALARGLRGILSSVNAGSFAVDTASEDIHTQIQNMLEKRVGPVALKLHTARSRNDQVIFATKLYTKVALLQIRVLIRDLVHGLETAAKKEPNKDMILPGFTHMQHAQPVRLKDYFGAYARMFAADDRRLVNVFNSIQLTLGAGALAGTPVEARHYTVDLSRYFPDIAELARSFSVHATDNSLYTVSDRDFIVETLGALSLIGMHLSRLAEDLILWSTKEFAFVDIDDAYCTGSSLMPQKKNADTLELMRGYTGRMYGNLVSVLTTMKGLPLAYNRDMQLDKEPLFDAVAVTALELEILTGLVTTLRFNRGAIELHLKDEALYATDIVYYLVKKGVAFKTAHSIVGQLIRHSIEHGIPIKAMTQRDLSRFSDKLTHKEIRALFDPAKSVASKRSILRRNA